jgi:hypothetical protein
MVKLSGEGQLFYPLASPSSPENYSQEKKILLVKWKAAERNMSAIFLCSWCTNFDSQVPFMRERERERKMCLGKQGADW